jgi:DNA polymerase-3 subunit delta'
MQARLAYAETARRARIIIIPWAEAMLHPAANTLLKILEEPPADTYFLLSSEDKAALLPTIRSRCTALAIPPMEAGEFQEAIAEKKDWWGDAPPRRLIPFAEGSLGTLLALHRHGGDALLEEGGRFLAAALGTEWRSFAGYLAESQYGGDMDSAARLLNFVLRMIRLFHRLEALEGPLPAADAEAVWTAEALRRQGWDPALASALAPLQGFRDHSALVAFIETSLSAIRDYAKPEMCLLGNYLEFETKVLRPALERTRA